MDDPLQSVLCEKKITTNKDSTLLKVEVLDASPPERGYVLVFKPTFEENCISSFQLRCSSFSHKYHLLG